MRKGFSKGHELEQVLLHRMEQRYAEGDCCSSITDFFENDSDKETHFSVLGDLGKRKTTETALTPRPLTGGQHFTFPSKRNIELFLNR